MELSRSELLLRSELLSERELSERELSEREPLCEPPCEPLSESDDEPDEPLMPPRDEELRSSPCVLRSVRLPDVLEVLEVLELWSLVGEPLRDWSWLLDDDEPLRD